MLARTIKYFSDNRWTIAGLSALVFGYYLVFARLVFNGEYTFGGDTHLYWSFKYLLFYSIEHFNTIPWWDPTEFNGFPLYFHIVCGWTNYFSPYTLPSLFLFKITNSILGVGINDYIVFHLTMYVFVSNLLAVYLISSEITKNKAATFFGPFMFAFSYFQLLNFHDFYVFEAMVAPLYLIYGLLYYNNRRTPSALLRFMFFSALFAASIQNGILMSAIFWTGLFVVFLIVLYRDILKTTVGNVRELLSANQTRVLFAGLCLLIVVGFVSAYLPFYLNSGNIVKYRNTVFELPGGQLHGVSLPMDYNLKGGITNQPVPITNSEIWTILLNWLPFPDIHDNLLRFTWDSHEFRYIGLVTIPLIFSGLILAARTMYVYIFLLAFFICNAFFVYADRNLAYKVMYDISDIIKNITNVSTILPRGGASLFLIFLSAIGLDALLSRAKASSEGEDVTIRHERFFAKSTTFLIIVSIFISLLGLLSPYFQGMGWIRHSFFHIGIYLFVFTFFCKVIFSIRNSKVSAAAVACLFVFSFMDLNVSSSAYLLNRHNLEPQDTSKHILIPYDKLQQAGKTLPDNLVFKPIEEESQNMFPASYMGVYHNVWVLMHGPKEWLYFASREDGAKVLENYNRNSFRMTEYPAFKFFSNAYYIPFESIASMDNNRQWYDSAPLFFLHDKGLVKEGEPPRPMPARYMLAEYTPNSVEMRVDAADAGFLYFLDNYDRFWSAYIDGVKVPVYRANFTFKAIKLLPGDHKISWVYDPWPVKAAYGAFYLLLFANMFLLSIFSKRGQDPDIPASD